ncbi:MAG: UDP-N-acetylmuramoyl-L-alanine--D-glutamate ligase [Acidimicrobiia bacterium]|nr:MAG: UDP-N-acetylmuramoyl-L-alanine--D-glutamate ligase [Acidimicrobiia bacterium]
MNVLVIGAAVSGGAAAHLARDRGHSVAVYDHSDEAAAGLRSKGFTVGSGAWDRAQLYGVDVVVTSPGVPEHAPPLLDAADANIDVWSELEFGARHLEAPVVAVTGTNGKTTVTAMTTSMLRESSVDAVAAGNIGTPVSSIVDGDYEVVVIEASSFQLRYIDTFHPKVAAILNVAPDHLDWHGTVAAYAAAKARIFENMNGADRLAYDVDDEGSVALAARADATTIPVSASTVPPGGVGVSGSELVVGGHRYLLPTDDPSYVGDLAFSAVLATEAGADAESIRRSIAGFTPGPHRRRLVGTIGGVMFVDDSKATNPHATRAAAASYERVVLIAGGRNKGLDLSDMVGPTVRHLVAYGEAGPEVAATSDIPMTIVAGFDAAVEAARRVAVPGDVVLLAPGCASFDQFSGYGERGDRFAALVLDGVSK